MEDQSSYTYYLHTAKSEKQPAAPLINIASRPLSTKHTRKMTPSPTYRRVFQEHSLASATKILWTTTRYLSLECPLWTRNWQKMYGPNLRMKTKSIRHVLVPALWSKNS